MKNNQITYVVDGDRVCPTVPGSLFNKYSRLGRPMDIVHRIPDKASQSGLS